jgi:hypothetical protein
LQRLSAVTGREDGLISEVTLIRPKDVTLINNAPDIQWRLVENITPVAMKT